MFPDLSAYALRVHKLLEWSFIKFKLVSLVGLYLKNNNNKAGVMAGICNPSIQDAKAGGSQVQG
jgi:hypothetical protein